MRPGRTYFDCRRCASNPMASRLATAAPIMVASVSPWSGFSHRACRAVRVSSLGLIEDHIRTVRADTCAASSRTLGRASDGSGRSGKEVRVTA